MSITDTRLNNLIRPLDAPALSLAEAGGKGANLGIMRRAGLPVPPGFVLTTSGYQAFVEAAELTASIEQQWRNLDTGDPTSFDRASAAIRTEFDAAALPPSLAEPLLAAYAGLGVNRAVAVRSSATAEDLPDASFAGQQDTYLNIVGEDALLNAVKRCWGSLWTARAMAYRLRRNISPAQVSLAVVVQEMVQADAAGVMFTLNPVSGDRSEIVVNATWGLGEALVSGRVNPDTIVADKQTGRIKQVEIGDKAVMTAATPTGTDEVAVDAARSSRQSITPGQVAELARLGA